jgi:hypothetical protein
VPTLCGCSHRIERLADWRRTGGGAGGQATTTTFAPDAAEVVGAVRRLTEQLPQLLAALGVEARELPPVWTVELIEGAAGWHVSKVRGACVEVAEALCGPVAKAAVALCAKQ